MLQYVFFYIGLANTTGVKASIIGAANVFIAIFLACYVFRYEKISILKIGGCLIGFFGVIVIHFSREGVFTDIHWNGEGAIFLSAFAYALSSGLIKRYSQKEDTVTLSGYQLLLGGVLTAVGLLLVVQRLVLV